MKLATSKGNEYDVMWAGESVGKHGRFLVQMAEVRTLVELIGEFDGIEWAKTVGPDGQPDKEFAGPMRLEAAARMDNGTVLITLEMEGAA